MKSKLKLFLLLTAVCIIGTVFLSACSTSIKADISEYGDSPIEIVGLTEDSFSVTPNQLAQLKCIKQTVKSTAGNEKTTVASGPTLNTFLEGYDCQQGDFTEIKVIAEDGYTKMFDQRFLAGDYDLILSIAYDDEPLTKKHRPLWLLIPDVTSDNWVKMVKRIEFTKAK